MQRKKWAVLALCLSLTGALAGCSTQDAASSQAFAVSSPSVAQANVTVTIPSALMEGANLTQTKKNAYANGVAEVVENDDGSLTYHMTQTAYDRMAKSTESDLKSLLASFQEGQGFPTIQEAQADEGYRNIVLLTDKAAYGDSYDSAAPATVGISALLYQIFHGVPSGEATVTVTLKDGQSGESFATFAFPMDA